ncbi:hypothetical protein [Roseixanthobacter pseudopolyaromaticivorans]|uniref:hypothetical protein n=1 Tax=Xanthobacteraceae TaxID=335928 RepID=UPI00372C7A15
MEASPPSSVPGTLPTQDTYNPCLGSGSLFTLSEQPRRVTKKPPIGFVHFKEKG